MEALSVVRTQTAQLQAALDQHRLMDALKHTSTLLAELRTGALSPKAYYELYMAVFDALRLLSAFLKDAHTTKEHHLADVYELVQYAGNILPRLYLMITVGSVYLGVEGAPKRELLRDMMEMCRGVQHPTRGLFLRHYLSGVTRDHLPVDENDGLEDTVDFILQNFVEMNKLWVRLQFQGHSRDRERREQERKELRILVGTNLVRLSQIDPLPITLYKRVILPTLLEQIIHCKDVIAQEYLMEVIIQVFPDEYHLETLDGFLKACVALNPKVGVRAIVVGLIERLVQYAAREGESMEDNEEVDEEQVESNEKETGAIEPTDHETATSDSKTSGIALTKKKRPPLYDSFWQQIQNMFKVCLRIIQFIDVF